uniref:Uncharacterized protein n=1 Tax=Oryza brachyantha TaxID=4533 RepID=J3MRQ3_ORYBR
MPPAGSGNQQAGKFGAPVRGRVPGGFGAGSHFSLRMAVGARFRVNQLYRTNLISGGVCFNNVNVNVIGNASTANRLQRNRLRALPLFG